MEKHCGWERSNAVGRVAFYLRFGAFLCLMVAILGSGVVFLIGYLPPTPGRVATILLMVALAVGLWLGARYLDKRQQE